MNKFKIGDPVHCKRADRRKDVWGYVIKLNDNGTPKIIERYGDENWENEGWIRNDEIPEDYVPRGKNLYWYTRNDDPSNYSLVGQESPPEKYEETQPQKKYTIVRISALEADGFHDLIRLLNDDWSIERVDVAEEWIVYILSKVPKLKKVAGEKLKNNKD